jgi:gephyrin
LLKLTDELRPNLILTTGGTGISPDDITPEATREVITKEIPGVSQTMITKSLAITPMAMISRPVCGVYQQTLIINLPGSSKGCVECVDFVYPVLRHAIDLIQNKRTDVAVTHSAMQGKADRKQHSCGGDHHHHHHVQTGNKCERLRHSPFPMISVDDAMKLIFEQANKMPIIGKPLTECLGYICAEEVIAKEPFPPFRASIKDGYAVRLYSDRSHEQIYEIVGRSDAGGENTNIPLTEGQCVVINTGAKLPDHANAVIQIEDTHVHEYHPTKKEGLDEKSIRINTECSMNQDIRDIGDDVNIGELVLEKNVILGPAELGLLATVGLQKIRVYDKPHVVVLSTGNELTSIDAPSTDNGKIRDSNKIMLMSALQDLDIPYVVDGGTAKDDETSVIQTLRSAFELADVVISTGGVSMGDKDLLKSTLLKTFNATIHFGRLAMKPGKPTTFATCEINGKKKLFFGLPGNPVSALVTYWLFVVPTLKSMMGNLQPHHPVIRVQLNQPIEYLDPRPEYLRVILEWSTKSSIPIARIVSPRNRCSSRLLSARRCTGLVRLPSKTDVNPSFFHLNQDGNGQQVDCLLLSL